MDERRHEYKEMQHKVKWEVVQAKRLDTKEVEKDLYKMVKQRDQAGKDFQQVWLFKDRDENVITSEKSALRR